MGGLFSKKTEVPETPVKIKRRPPSHVKKARCLRSEDDIEKKIGPQQRRLPVRLSNWILLQRKKRQLLHKAQQVAKKDKRAIPIVKEIQVLIALDEELIRPRSPIDLGNSTTVTPNKVVTPAQSQVHPHTSIEEINDILSDTELL